MDQARIGFCCTFSPDGVEAASIARLDPAGQAARLEVVGRNRDRLDEQIA